MRTKYSSPFLYKLYTDITDIRKISLPLIFSVIALLFIMQTKIPYLFLITIPIIFFGLVFFLSYTTIAYAILDDPILRIHYGGTTWNKINVRTIDGISKTKIDDIPYYNEVYKYEIYCNDNSFSIILKENDFDSILKKMIVSKELS